MDAKIHILFYESSEDPARALPYFSDSRKQKYFHSVNPKVRFQQAAAELAVCAAMKEAGFPFEPPEYSYDGLGRPCMKDAFLSISHTDRTAACIVFSKPVGLDMEAERRINPALANKILCSREFSEFSESRDQNGFLLGTWVVKESFLKFTGTGLRSGMKNTDFNAAKSTVSDQCGQKYFVSRHQLSSPFRSSPDFTGRKTDYFISLCTQKPVETGFIIYNSFADIISYLKK